MNSLRQIAAVTAMNLRGVPSRLGASLVSVIGTAGVVAVLVSVLAMSTGMRETMRGTGRADRVIVMRSGAATEMTSSVGQDEANIVADAPGVRRDGTGQPIASAEILSLVQLAKKNGTDVSVPMRGVGPQASALRPEIRIVAGRPHTPGVHEVIVGKGARAQYADLDVGGRVQTQGAAWTIVGVFESGDAHESELMTDSATLQSSMRRVGSIQSVTVMLESPAAFDGFRDSLAATPQLSVDVIRERDYFAAQSGRVSRLLSIVAYVVGAIMAVGAIFGALNTMYAAVGTRVVEIATLRAIGFSAVPVVVSVLVESLLLALLGSVIGAGWAWLFLNGQTVSTAAGAMVGESRVFSLHVTPALVALGITSASAIGFIGGLLPAIRAARLPVAAALRAL